MVSLICKLLKLLKSQEKYALKNMMATKTSNTSEYEESLILLLLITFQLIIIDLKQIQHAIWFFLAVLE